MSSTVESAHGSTRTTHGITTEIVQRAEDSQIDRVRIELRIPCAKRVAGRPNSPELYECVRAGSLRARSALPSVGPDADQPDLGGRSGKLGAIAARDRTGLIGSLRRARRSIRRDARGCTRSSNVLSKLGAKGTAPARRVLAHGQLSWRSLPGFEGEYSGNRGDSTWPLRRKPQRRRLPRKRPPRRKRSSFSSVVPRPRGIRPPGPAASQSISRVKARKKSRVREYAGFFLVSGP